jgi:prevent-host-death family protein
MTQTLPKARSLELSDFLSNSLVELAGVQADEAPLVIERNGEPMVAVVPMAEFERWRREREWEAGTRALERISAAYEDVPLDVLEAKVAEAIAEGRAARRAARKAG